MGIGLAFEDSGEGQQDAEGRNQWKGEEIPCWEKAWIIWLKKRNPHRGLGLKLWKTFVFVPCFKKGGGEDGKQNYLK